MKNTRQYILTGLALALMGAAAAVLIHMQAHQRLGDPGVKTRPIAGSKNLEILMPRTGPDYTSVILTNSEAVLTSLPADTSFRSLEYTTADQFTNEMTTVLMGTDRTSIHQPEICLPGQGWTIQDSFTKVVKVTMDRPVKYELPVNRIIAKQAFKDEEGNVKVYSGIYAYWYVDADRYTASSTEWKIWLMPHDLLTRGVLDRWAYISCFTWCEEGQEEAIFARMEKLIAEIVPEFQLVPLATR